jgi:hypothetical protein
MDRAQGFEGGQARERAESYCGFFQERVMQSKLVSICSQLAEVGVFVGAAAALAAGMLGLR